MYRRPIKPGTHWQQGRKLTCRFVAILSKVSCLRLAVDIVVKVEHVQLGRLYPKWMIFVARMSNVLSTWSPVCTGPYTTIISRILLCENCFCTGKQKLVFLRAIWTGNQLTSSVRHTLVISLPFVVNKNKTLLFITSQEPGVSDMLLCNVYFHK